MKQREVFFETVTGWYRPLVAWYLRRGARVIVFDFEGGLPSIGWTRRLITQGRLERVYVKARPQAERLAIDATEWLFPRFARHRLVRLLGEIFGEREVEAVLKKGLLDAVFRDVFIQVFLREHRQQAPRDSGVVFVPHASQAWEPMLKGWLKERDAACEGLVCPWWVNVWSRFANRLSVWTFSLLMGVNLLSHVFAIALGRRLARKPPAVKHYHHVYAVDQAFQAKFQGPRRFDFLLDHTQLTKENTAFLVHPSAEGAWMEAAVQEGYQVIRGSAFADVWHPARHLRRPARTVRLRTALRAAWQLGAHPFTPRWLTHTTGRGVLTYLTRSAFLEHTQFVNYVYMNQDGVMQRWWNALLRQAGRESWNFAFSISGGYLYSQDSHYSGPRRAFAYQNEDHGVVFSQRRITYQQSHRQRVGRYHDTGNIWSELVRLAQDTGQAASARAQWFGQRAGQGKVLAWFDTSFVQADRSPSTFAEGLAGYRDLLRWLEEDEKLLVVVKPSKDEGYFLDSRSQWAHPLGKPLMALWAALKRHPRVYFAGETADPALVIAASDLTVTFCFSSPTAEALGARKQAIWYEPGQRWRDTLYGREPLLVAHGYEELKRVSNRLLYEMGEAEYQQFLDHRIRGVVEDHLDGHGLSRFRALLVGTREPGRASAALQRAEGVLV